MKAGRLRALLPLLLAALCYAAFYLLAPQRVALPSSALEGAQSGRVVVSAPVLLLLHAGDRFLASNMETIRLSATGIDLGLVDLHYLRRAQRVVAEINPCDEQNYYLANALLTWGGAVDEGEQVLLRAIDCRFWDERPPFFYGFNRYFFLHDVPGAVSYVELAAQRATSNAPGFRKLAIMMQAEQIADEKLALKFLQGERDKANDPRLEDMLSKRVDRLDGLVRLREAQRQYERRFGHPLQYPRQLLDSGLLTAYPQDPMKLGYEFVDGRFMLKKMRIAGVESR